MLALSFFDSYLRSLLKLNRYVLISPWILQKLAFNSQLNLSRSLDQEINITKWRRIIVVGMFSTMGGLQSHRKLLQLISSHSYNSTTSIVRSNEDDMMDWYITVIFLSRLLIYVTVLSLLVIVVYMIMKYISEYEDRRSTTEDVHDYDESSPILTPAKTMPETYGTCDQWDIESGNCSGGSSSSITSSSEELYDGKICVICYTEPRNCFLVPCGHCATCYDCAQRIFEGEARTCPICRRLIRKVRKLCTG